MFALRGLPHLLFVMRRTVAQRAIVCLNPPPMSRRTDEANIRVTGRRRGGGGGFEETARRRIKAKQKEYFVGRRLLLEQLDELGRTIFSPSRLLPVSLKPS